MVWARYLCRICAQIGNACYPIFDQNCGHNIELKIKKCFSFAVCKDDYKPKEICNGCYVKLNEFYDFIELCHASNNKFETMIYSSHQGVWLEKQTNNFEEYQMSGVIVNTKNSVENQLISIDYDSALNVNQEPNYNVPELSVTVDYISETNAVSKQSADKSFNKNYTHNYDHNQTVLRHSSDFYKPVETTEFNELNYINLQLDQQNVNYNVTSVTCKTKNDCDKTEKIEQSGAQIKKFTCQHCNKTFKRKINLNSHLAIHTKSRPFSCDVCQKSFAIDRYLTCHKRIHTNTNRCKYCAKNFSVPSKLRRHLQIHANVKPYACTVDGCGKAFSDKYNLVGHRAAHSGNREFVCDICNKGYKTNSKLKDHRKVHSDETPFKCDICDKTYKWKTNLTVHMKKHDGYKCVRCKKDCEKLSALFRHRKTCDVNITNVCS